MKKTPKITILVGCQGAGKSTFSEYYLKFNDLVRFNRDDMRQMMQFSTQMDGNDEALLTRLMEKMIAATLAKRRNVLLDNTHLRTEYLDQIVEKFNHLANIEFKILDVPWEELVERNATRQRKVPARLLRDSYERFQKLKTTYDFSFRPKQEKLNDALMVVQNTALPKAILCDLDGTLALAKRNMYRPTEEEIYSDTVNEPVLTALKGFAKDAKLIFVSGREALYKDVTQRWLAEKAQLTDFELFMRNTEDTRKDSIIKEEILNTLILPNYHVLGVFDDRLQVCEMWYEKGIFCFNVNQGLVEF